MKSAKQWFKEYGESHQNPTNKLIHWICVPAIFFSFVGLLTSIPSQTINSWLPENLQPYFNFATVAMLLALIFYLMMSWRIFLGMVLIAVITIWGNIQLDSIDFLPLWALSIIIFALAWIGQFIGHHIEGAKPSFFKDLQFLLVGPAWLLGFIYKRLGMEY